MPKPVNVSHCDEKLEEVKTWRRQCGCIRTSDKLKKILHSFPAPPPPSPFNCAKSCQSNYCMLYQPAAPVLIRSDSIDEKKWHSTTWHLIADVVQLVQLSVTATALALYYIIYCYMQLVYYTLRSALYFHNADVPMKITIGVVTMTSIVVGFNIILRLGRVLEILY